MTVLSVIIVTYNSLKHVAACLNSLLEVKQTFPVQIIVVDNNSTDGSVSVLNSYAQEILLISNSQNFGYAGGNNIGAKYAKGNVLLFLNPDTIVNTPALKQMLSVFENNEKAGVVGPRLLNMDNSIQDYYCKDYSVTSIILRRIAPSFAMYLAKLQTVFGGDNRLLTSVDWILGSAIMVPKEIFERVGRFNEKYRLYFEDVDLCRRVRKNGYKVIYNPLAQIYHDHQRESAQGFSKKTLWHIQSAIKYFNLHGWKI